MDLFSLQSVINHLDFRNITLMTVVPSRGIRHGMNLRVVSLSLDMVEVRLGYTADQSW